MIEIPRVTPSVPVAPTRPVQPTRETGREPKKDPKDRRGSATDEDAPGDDPDASSDSDAGKGGSINLTV